MCWSFEASAVMAGIGFFGAYFEFKKAFKPSLALNDRHALAVAGLMNVYTLRGITLFYFSLMELLQAVNYLYLDDPGYMNALCAKLGFIHIAFQPIFIVWYILSYMPLNKRQQLIRLFTGCALIVSCLQLCRLIIHPDLPGCFAHRCVGFKSLEDFFSSYINPGQYPYHKMSCSAGQFKSHFGSWHIAWLWPMNVCSFDWLYALVSFIFPLFYGAWRVTLYGFLCGPVLAMLLTGHPDEFSAIWCLLSIGFLSAAKLPFLQKALTMRIKGAYKKLYC